MPQASKRGRRSAPPGRGASRRGSVSGSGRAIVFGGEHPDAGGLALALPVHGGLESRSARTAATPLRAFGGQQVLAHDPPVRSCTRGRTATGPGPGLRRTAGAERYPAGRRAGGSSAHIVTVWTRAADGNWIPPGSAAASRKLRARVLLCGRTSWLEQRRRQGWGGADAPSSPLRAPSTSIAVEPHSAPEPFRSVRQRRPLLIAA
jgi:hypothetical protein